MSKKISKMLEHGRFSLQDLNRNKECIRQGASKSIDHPMSTLWFLPIVTHALKGGVRTIFHFSEMLSIKYGTTNIFVIYSFNGRDFDTNELSKSLRENFPKLKFVLKKFIRGINSIEELPRVQIAFCTLWTTAYLLLRYNKTYRKYYFMQDFEPMFYEGGDLYVIIEQTYRFGFSVIANTEGVAQKARQYTDRVVYFTPGVDRETFFPMARKKDRTYKQIVFYGRPNPRNCFKLGLSILTDVKKELGSDIRICSVGADWSPKDYGLDGIVDNLGLLPTMSAVANLYRNSDMGLVFMATPHPSYQPLEYMASGCVVATNINEGTSWLLNETNSLLLEPNPWIAAERILSTLSDEDSMQRLRNNGLRTASKLHWPNAFGVFEHAILNSEELSSPNLSIRHCST